MQHYKKYIGERIKFERMMWDMTRLQLAEKSGVSVNTIERIENGENTTIDTILILAEALEIPWERLVKPVGKGRLLLLEKNAYGSYESSEEISERLGTRIKLPNNPRPNPAQAGPERGWAYQKS